MANSKNTDQKQKVHNSPGTLILQWLSYALWGLLAISLIFLATITINFFLDTGNSPQEGVVYPVSAVIILLITATITDLLYSSREDIKNPKTGVSSIISIVHTVIFVLGATACLTVAVFSAIQLITALEHGPAPQTALYVSLVIFVFFLALVFRITLFKKPSLARQLSRLAMIIISATILGLGISGPLVREVQSKQDRLIEASISDIYYAIDTYTVSNQQLPSDLSKLEFANYSLATEAIAQNLIDYRPNTLPVSNGKHFYQLCVNYQFARDSRDSYKPLADQENSQSDYLSYLSAYDHAQGPVCYKLYTTATTPEDSKSNF